MSVVRDHILVFCQALGQRVSLIPLHIDLVKSLVHQDIQKILLHVIVDQPAQFQNGACPGLIRGNEYLLLHGTGGDIIIVDRHAHLSFVGPPVHISVYRKCEIPCFIPLDQADLVLRGSISLIGVLRGRKAEHLGDLVCIPVIIPHLARLDKGDDGAVLIDHIGHIVIRDPQQNPRSAQYLPRGI